MNLEDVEYKIVNSVRHWAHNSVHNSAVASVGISVYNSVDDSVWDSVNIGLQIPIRQERVQG